MAGMMPAAMVPEATGDGPKLPPVMGDCPAFKNGTVMVAGHKSIVLQAGAAGKKGPLLFYWHGTGSSASEASMFPGNGEITMSGGVVAAFNGNQSSGKGRDCSGTGAHNMADFDAADQLAACGAMSDQIDSRRIYSTGCSAGGLQTGCMAMVRSSYLAAVAPNSGGIVGAQPWQDMHTPAVFTMHGSSSADVVIVTFSETSASFDMASKMHGGFVVNCDHGGGHCGAPRDLQSGAWKFMKDHPWGVGESPWKAAIPSGVPSYCKIY
jgi:poly(3-hydroxybutyrate) depolymerase